MNDAPSSSSTVDVKPFVPRKQVAQDYFKKLETRKVAPPSGATPRVKIEAAPPIPLPAEEDIKPPAVAEDEFEDDLDLSRIEDIEAHIPAVDDKKPLQESPEMFPFSANDCSESDSTPMEVAAPFVVDNSEVIQFHRNNWCFKGFGRCSAFSGGTPMRMWKSTGAPFSSSGKPTAPPPRPT